MVKTNVGNLVSLSLCLSLHSPGLFCSSTWVSAGGVSVWWGCFSEEQLSGIEQRCCCFSVYLDEPSTTCPSLHCIAKASSIWSRAKELHPLQRSQSIAVPFSSLLLCKALQPAGWGGLVCLRKDLLCCFGRWPGVGVIQLLQLSPSTHLPFLTAGENGLLWL